MVRCWGVSVAIEYRLPMNLSACLRLGGYSVGGDK
jgi:hypothetical protein